MPLIDDQTTGLERRPAPRWPWVLVTAGLGLLWLLIAGVVSLVPRGRNRPVPASPKAAVQQYVSQQIQSAENYRSIGQWQQGAAIIQTVTAESPMDLMDRHHYYRCGAECLTNGGSPLAGSRYYERYLSFATQIHSKACADCHNSTSNPPLKLADMQTSKLGKDYVAALGAAGKLSSTRDKLRRELKKQESIRGHLLLYYIETALEDPKAAAAHARKLREFDKKH